MVSFNNLTISNLSIFVYFNIAIPSYSKYLQYKYYKLTTYQNDTIALRAIFNLLNNMVGVSFIEFDERKVQKRKTIHQNPVVSVMQCVPRNKLFIYRKKIINAILWKQLTLT